MIKKHNIKGPCFKRNPVAKDLRTPVFKKRVIKNKKKYNRKKIKKNF